MSTAPSKNAGCGKVLLYVLLAGGGLWLGKYVLTSLYYGFSYFGANTLLALDLSIYGQAVADYWPGYALLGAGLGAAGGAIAAQRRFGLARGVAVAGWVTGLALLGLVYATVFVAEPVEEKVVDETSLPARPRRAPARARARVAPAPKARSKAVPDTTSTLAEGQQQVIVRVAPLRAVWLDSLAAPTAYLHRGDTVRLLRRARRWVQVAAADAAGEETAGWLPRAGLGPLASPAPVSSPAEAAPAASPCPGRPPMRHSARPAAPDSLPPAREVASATHPLGRQQHTGRIGSLAVTYRLDWQPTGELSGSYFYSQQPAVVYRLTGSVRATGELHLLEFTRGRESARCVLQRQGESYAGTMRNADGRQFPMTLELP